MQKYKYVQLRNHLYEHSYARGVAPHAVHMHKDYNNMLLLIMICNQIPLTLCAD